MTTLWQTTYRDFAQNINDSISDPPDTVEYIYNSLLVIINLDSSEEGTFIASSFLNSINLLYLNSLHTILIELYVKKVIREINDFTLRNYDTNLKNFVNYLDWNDGCVPFFWAEYSSDLGYNISNWNTCS